MSTNITKQKRDALVSKINQIREFLTKSSDENATRLLGFLGELENDVTNKHYGLIFEEHRESIDEKLETNLPVLTEEKSLEIDNGGLRNFLIEGDNLASLKLLEKTHRGKIDVIYIDPPYNTGNKDFIYDDCFIDSTDTFRHSKWCSFMKKRLEIARRLLSEKGVIFISIDDNEQAALKLLCDRIFGEGNFVGIQIWRKKSGGGQTDDYFVTEHEYILTYRKSDKFEWVDEKLDAQIEDFKYSDEIGNFKIMKLEKWGTSPHKEDRPTMYFPIRDPDGNDFYPIAPDGKDGRWRVGKERLEKLIKTNGVFWGAEKKTNRWIPYEKIYFNEANGKLLKSRSILYDVAETGTATNTLTELFGAKDVFSNPKPVELIEFLLKHSTINSQLSTVNSQFSTILDFFAGSGTTGHAVMKLNATDGGNRKFILCTNNQNNICRDITYERLKRVIEKENYSASLKYFRVDFVDITDKLYYEYADELLEHTRELVELENAINFNRNSKIAICLTEEELDSFCNSKKKINAVEKIYLGHEVQTTAEQEDLFNSKQIEIVRIPNYYYSDVE